MAKMGRGEGRRRRKGFFRVMESKTIGKEARCPVIVKVRIRRKRTSPRRLTCVCVLRRGSACVVDSNLLYFV